MDFLVDNFRGGGLVGFFCRLKFTVSSHYFLGGGGAGFFVFFFAILYSLQQLKATKAKAQHKTEGGESHNPKRDTTIRESETHTQTDPGG